MIILQKHLALKYRAHAAYLCIISWILVSRCHQDINYGSIIMIIILVSNISILAMSVYIWHVICDTISY